MAAADRGRTDSTDHHVATMLIHPKSLRIRRFSQILPARGGICDVVTGIVTVPQLRLIPKRAFSAAPLVGVGAVRLYRVCSLRVLRGLVIHVFFLFCLHPCFLFIVNHGGGLRRQLADF